MNIKTLIIDDDPICHIIVKKIAESLESNHNDFVFNGHEALKFLEKNILSNELPDVIFLDINMPYMNGWDFLEWYDQFINKIKSRSLPIPLLYILSSSDNSVDTQYHEKYSSLIKRSFLKPMTIDRFQKVLLDYQKSSRKISF